MVKDHIALLLLGAAVAVFGMTAVWVTFGPLVVAMFQVIPGN